MAKNQTLVQFRVDSDLKNEVSEIYSALGMDLPTAFRMFMVRSKMVRGIPFETVLPENAVTRAEGLEAFEKLREQATDVPEMSLDEINAEIAEVRKNRRKELKSCYSPSATSNCKSSPPKGILTRLSCSGGLSATPSQRLKSNGRQNWIPLSQ